MQKAKNKKKKEVFEEPGRCPSCGKFTLDYYNPKLDGGTLVYPARCSNCNTMAEEVYALEYITTAMMEQRD